MKGKTERVGYYSITRPNHIALVSHLTITNWRLQRSLHVKPTRILGGHFEKIETFYKFSQKSETSSHQSNNSNYNNHMIGYLF